MWFTYASMGLGAHVIGTLMIKYITRFLDPLEILILYGAMIFVILSMFITGITLWKPTFLQDLWGKIQMPTAPGYQSKLSMKILLLLIFLETFLVVTRGYFNWKSIQLASNPAYSTCMYIIAIPIIAVLSSLFLGSQLHKNSIIGFLFMAVGVWIISSCPDDPITIKNYQSQK